MDNTHHMRALLSRISPNKLLLLLFIIIIMKTYNRCLVSFSNLVIVLIIYYLFNSFIGYVYKLKMNTYTRKETKNG